MKRLLIANKGQPHPNVVQLKDAYILVHPQRVHNNKSLIIVQEYFDTTLHEILMFRQQHNWAFTEAELCAFLRDMSSALAFLHSIGVSHRDIRPCNIWYIGAQKTYKIGGFDESKMIDAITQKKLRQQQQQRGGQAAIGQEELNTVRGVPQYLSPEILELLQVNSVQKVLLYDPYKLDIYALGLTMIMMKNRQTQVDFETLQNKIKLRTGNVDVEMGAWSMNAFVKKMVAASKDERISAEELSRQAEEKYPFEDYPKVNEGNLITSLKFKKKKESDDRYLADQEQIAQQYFNLFDVSRWIYKYEEVLAHFDNYHNDIYKARVLAQIGEGFLIEQDLTRSRDYFLRASVIYNDLGHQLQAGAQLEGAAKYYEQAIDCQRKATNGEDTAELGLLLENIGNVYRELGHLDNAKAYEEEALRIIVKEKGEQSTECVRILNNLGNVYTSEGKYKKAEKRLKRALKIADVLYLNEEQQGKLKAMCLCNLGEVQRLKGNLEKAKRCLEEALAIREQVFGSGHIDIAANVENLGNVYFDLGDFHRAKKEYERALVIKKSKLPDDSPDIALTLNNIGNVCKNLGEIDKAMKYYEDCIFILQQKHGQDAQNTLIANCLGNMGLMYLDTGNEQMAAKQLEHCLSILAQTVGQQHPDYEFFLTHYQKLRQ